MKKIRVLTAQEKTLWALVAKSIKPVRRGSVQAEMSMSELMETSDNLPVSEDPDTERKTIETKSFLPVPSSIAQKKKLLYPPLAPIERNLRRRLSKGKADIDGKLDLHGLNQEDAYHALTAFIHRAVLHNKSLVLIVTGKGGRKAQSEAYHTGILRRMVPIWLSDPALRGLVIGFEEAAIAHGGAGALYVRLRRARS